MRLLQLVGITNTFQRCAECSHLVQPAIIGQFYNEQRSKFHCFRCFHILHAVTVADRSATEGSEHAAA